MRMKRFLPVLAAILLTAARGVVAQEPVPVDEEPPVDQELPADPDGPVFEEPAGEPEMPAEDELPQDLEPPEEPEVPAAVPAPPVQPPKAAPRKKSAPAARAPQASSFRVRVAAAGSGFGGGASGTLRISGAGVSFVREGQTREDWTIRWGDLAEAGNAGGLWDAPHPLVLKESGGQKRFIAYIDQKGRYLSGQPVIDAIAKNRRTGG